MKALLISTDVKHSKIILKNKSELDGPEGNNYWSTASLYLYLLQIQVTDLRTFLNSI